MGWRANNYFHFAITRSKNPFTMKKKTVEHVSSLQASNVPVNVSTCLIDSVSDDVGVNETVVDVYVPSENPQIEEFKTKTMRM